MLHASSERAFCAGSDIKPLIAELQEDHDSLFTKEYFAAEYFVDYLIHVYPKPILCWADGISMGGGIGIMTGACCRVVTERSVIAMPEIAIGFFTDVEATYFLNRLPLGLGLFLGLTGARFEGFDAVALRMADDSGDIIVISRYLLGRSSDFSQAQISPGQFLNQLYKRLVFRWPS